MARHRDWAIQTRATLLARIKDYEDHESWMEFYTIYSRLIYALARHRGLSHEEAQDVVVETIASAARHMPGFNYDRKVGSFRSWLLQMARWRIIDQYKRRPPHVVSHSKGSSKGTGGGDSDVVFDPAATDVEKMWNAEWERCLLDRATDKARRNLNPKHFQVYDLCVKKEWEYEKVARFLSIPIEQVYLAKHRVSKAIMAEIERLRNEII